MSARRWTLYRGGEFATGTDPEVVEVMPVSEHEEAQRAAERLVWDMGLEIKRLREAAQAVVDEFGWSESCGYGLHIAALRAALNTGGPMASAARGIEDGPEPEPWTSPRPVSTTRAAPHDPSLCILPRQPTAMWLGEGVERGGHA